MTPDEVNALPERVRRYIHDLETNADPAGMVRENILVREENAQLRALVEADHQDAERYRWLRDSTSSKGFIACYFMYNANDVRQMTGSIADAAIDAAMGSGGGK